MEVVVANMNAPQQTVVSGSRAAIDEAVAWCTEHDLRARPLPVACAFHSTFVEPAQRRLAEMLRRTEVAPPRLPVYSNTTAAPYPDEPDAIVDVLAEHLIRPVDHICPIELRTGTTRSVPDSLSKSRVKPSMGCSRACGLGLVARRFVLFLYD